MYSRSDSVGECYFVRVNMGRQVGIKWFDKIIWNKHIICK